MKLWKICSLAILVTIFASSAFAQEPTTTTTPNPFFAKLKVRYMPEVEAKNQSGDIEMSKIVFRIGYQTILSSGVPFYMTVGPDHYTITQDTAVDLPPDAKSRGIRVGVELPLASLPNDGFFLGLELNPTFQTAKGVAFASEAFRFNFSPKLIYKGDNGFEWVVGATIRPRYEMMVLPIFGFNYRATDRLSFNLVSDDPHVSYKLTDKMDVQWWFDYTFDEFEVISGPLEGSVLQIQDFATGPRLEYRINNHWTANVGAGWVFNRIVKYDSEQGKVTRIRPVCQFRT